MEQVIYSPDEATQPLILPGEEESLMGAIAWGSAAEPFTPAFWRALMHQHGTQPPALRLGDSVLEEAAACLLGGYGIPAEVGLAAYARLRALRLLVPSTSLADIQLALSEPLEVRGRLVRYRFAASKAQAVWELVRRFRDETPPSQPLALREWLMRCRGIGLKTASWVVRNHLDCDEVAILDVHLLRAGYLMGVFPAEVSLPRDYLALEQKFLELATALGVKASHLDACIWAQMKRAGDIALEAFEVKRQAEQDSLRQRRKPVATKPFAKAVAHR